MPAPIPDLSRDQTCHPGSNRPALRAPALKGEYYCYHHHIKHANRNSRRILIDPEITCMEIPPIEDRASIFYALAAVVHRLAENTIDTRRAGQMIYGLQAAMRALEPPRTAANPGAPEPALSSSKGSSPLYRDDPGVTPTASVHDEPAADTADSISTAPDPATGQPATNNLQPATALKTIPITKESLLYFLRSRHCYNCNAELFPASELTERRNPGATSEVIEEAHQALPAPDRSQDQIPAHASNTLSTLQAVAESRPLNRAPAGGKIIPPYEQVGCFRLSAYSFQTHSLGIKPFAFMDFSNAIALERPPIHIRHPLCFTLT